VNNKGHACSALVRCLKLRRLLLGGSLSLESLATTFGVSTRTIWRDIKALQAAGEHVHYLPAHLDQPARQFLQQAAQDACDIFNRQHPQLGGDKAERSLPHTHYVKRSDYEFGDA
jgi:biotin operon repressor